MTFDFNFLFHSYYFSNNLRKKSKLIERNTCVMKIDEIDRRILNALQKSGRMSNAELAEKVNLSASACHRRVQRLETDGIIRDYVALLDPRTVDRRTTVFVEISLSSQADETLAPLKKP